MPNLCELTEGFTEDIYITESFVCDGKYCVMGWMLHNLGISDDEMNENGIHHAADLLDITEEDADLIVYANDRGFNKRTETRDIWDEGTPIPQRVENIKAFVCSLDNHAD